MDRLRTLGRPILLVLMSAAAMWAAFPEANLWFMAIPSLALLVAAVDRETPLRAAAYTGLWAMVFFIPHLSWINVATGGVYLAWILLAVSQAFFLGIWGALFAAVTRAFEWARTWWGEASVAAVFWVGIEQLRARVPFGGFPWAKVAYSQVESPLVAFAPIGGEVLVSGLCVTLAVLIRRSLTPGPHPRGRVFMAGAAISIYLAPAAITLPTQPQDGTLRASAVQGNVEIPMFETYSVEGKVTGNHLRQTLVMLESGTDPEVIFWGEDSIDRDPNNNRVTGEMIEQVLEASGVPLVAGYQEYADNRRYNWIGIWYPEEGQSEQRYGKQHPVPWGEFVPWRSISEILAVEAAQVAVDMVAVDNPGYLEVELGDGRTLRLAVGICFEVADEQILAEGVRMGGQMILIPTNNSHFRYSAESTQQLQMLQFRSAEFSRAGLQVSTNGVSAFVRPDGSVEEVTNKQVAVYLTSEVPLRTTLTPAAVVGQIPAFIAIGITLVGGGVALLTPRRGRKL